MARLHSRIYLHFLSVLLIVGVTTSLVFALGARDVFRRHMADGMARQLALLAGERFADPPGLAARLRQLHENLHLDVRVRDTAGRIVASVGDELPSLTTAEATAVREGRTIIRRHPGLAAAPVRDPGSGTLLGSVEATMPPPMGPPALWRPALMVGIVLLVVGVATRPLARRISRPLERLTDAVRRLGGGDLGARVPITLGRHRRADELTELTRAFNEMAERLERLVRGEKQLLANISHELRSPLARIRMALELLPREGDSDRRLRDVERDLAELDRLIEDVLTTARLDASDLPARLATLDASLLLAQLAERARHDPLTAPMTVRIEEGPPVTLIADEALLRRALWNLIENAAKYGAPPITLAVARRGDAVSLSVSDEGAGIPPAHRERVFAPFYRGDAARTPEAGSEARRGVGLGLTLARRVAEVHGGTITIGPAAIDNGQERGCRVVLSLPPVTGGG